MSGPPAIARLLCDGLTAGGARAAVIAGDRLISYRQLAEAANQVAADLKRLGLESGHRLALLIEFSPEMVAILLGALQQGLVVSILSTALGQSARQYRLDELRPNITVAYADGLKIRAPVQPWPRWECRPGMVMWTSGTTGTPKGAYLSLDAILWNAERNAAALGISASDRALVALDPAYCYALIHQIFTHLCVGASIVIPRQLGWLPGIDREILDAACTTLAVVPSMLRTILPGAKQLNHLRVVTVGGAQASPALLEAAHTSMPDVEIYVTYGLTEAGPRVATRRSLAGQPRPGNVGRPLPGVEIALAPDKEILVETGSMSTATVVAGALHLTAPPLRTGDLGVWEADGTLRILGRRSRAINRGGLKIPAEEVERVLRANAGVRDARVMAVEDPRFGEVATAYVVLSASANDVDLDDMGRRCFRELGAAFVPKQIEIVDELPQFSLNWKEGLT